MYLRLETSENIVLKPPSLPRREEDAQDEQHSRDSAMGVQLSELQPNYERTLLKHLYILKSSNIFSLDFWTSIRNGCHLSSSCILICCYCDQSLRQFTRFLAARIMLFLC